MGRAAACGVALRNFELTKSGSSDFATLEPFLLLTPLAIFERPGAGGCASYAIGAGALGGPAEPVFETICSPQRLLAQTSGLSLSRASWIELAALARDAWRSRAAISSF
jgi:hypothetical protein